MTSHDMPDLGTNVRVRREHKNLSQYELADAAGVSRGTIAAVEGGHLPSLRILAAIAKALDTTPDRLIRKRPRTLAA